MKKLINFRPNGQIISTSIVPDDTPEDGMIAVPIDTDVCPFKQSVADGILVDIPSVARTLPDYTDQRRQDYPPVQDQLDALWHAMDAGILPKAPGFYEPLLNVKRKYPKGDGNA